MIPKYSLIVCVRREGNVVDLHLERQLLAAHRCDLLGFREDHLSEGALDAVAGHDATVLGVCAPVLKELSRQAALHHAWNQRRLGWETAEAKKIYTTG